MFQGSSLSLIVMLKCSVVTVLMFACLAPNSLCQVQVISPLTDAFPLPKIAHRLRAQQKWLSETNITFLEKHLTGFYTNLLHRANSEGNASECLSSLLQFTYDQSRGDLYTKQAIDSLGKPKSGLLLGNFKWYGRYDECLNTKGDQFQGKWCSIVSGEIYPFTKTVIGLTVGLCVPDTCSEEFLNDVLSSYMNGSGLTANAQCPVQPTEWKAPDVIFIIILSILVILVVSGTALDSYIKNKKQMNELVIDDNGELAKLDLHESSLNSAWEEALVSFSIVKNVKALFTVKRKPETIDCLHGIRFISMSWIVLGHTFLAVFGFVDNPVDMVNYFHNSFTVQAPINAFFAVDSFFFLSGLLVTYLTLKNANRLTRRSVPMFYLRRYLRLTPAYAFFILFLVGFYGKIGSGPNWPATFNSEYSSCMTYWWTNMLYINNLHPSAMLEECFSTGWYLANDMQFFLLAPISLLIMQRSPKVGLSLQIFGILSSMLVTGVISAHYQLQPYIVVFSLSLSEVVGGGLNSVPQNNSSLADIDEMQLVPAKNVFWSDTYTKPWCRIGVYLLGMITGYLLVAKQSSIRMSKIFVMTGWAVAAALNLSVVYGLWWYLHNMTKMDASLTAFYDAMCRPVWAVGLAWVVIACATGHGGPVNSFLSWKAFVPLSRLTFCTYLVHGIITSFWFGSLEVDIHYSTTQIAFFYVAILAVSYGGAFILAMLVESPFVNLLKAVTKKRESSKPMNGLTVNEVPNE